MQVESALDQPAVLDHMAALDNPIPALIFGACLVLIGIAMLFFQKKQLSKVTDDSVSKRDRQFYRKRYRRRSQVAGLIILIGVMIPVGDSVMNLREMPITFSIFWMVVMGLALWVALLAIGDLLAARLHLADEINQLHRERLGLGLRQNPTGRASSGLASTGRPSTGLPTSTGRTASNDRQGED